jgi:hypothetical protein
MVKPPDPIFSVLVLTEDRKPRATAVVRDLTKRLFTCLDERCQTHKIRFDPPEPWTDGLTTANLFQSRRHPDRVRFFQYVAATLRNDNAFVVHHVDADRRWDDRLTNPSANAAAVETDLVPHVRAILSRFYSEAEIDARLTRYLRLVPHWEIEAWLYQNTERAARLCPGPPRCQRQPSGREQLAGWRADRPALDEVEHPSEALCLGKRHNDDLVVGFPTAAVVAAKQALAAAADAVLACDPLLRAIQRTYEPPERAPEPG